MWPKANWGLRTGSKDGGGSGIVVVDIDSKSGGFVSWGHLREENPELIETVTVTTGNGGEHLWFAYPERIKIRSGVNVLGEGIDIRADGGYVLIPPSHTVQQYRFDINPDDSPIAELPNWILSTFNSRLRMKKTVKLSAAMDHDSVVNQGKRHQTLVSVAGSMRRVGFDIDIIQTALQVIRDKKFLDGNHPVTDDELSRVIEWNQNKTPEFSFSDLGNAERFFRDHGDDVRYCFKWEKWLVWDGKRWEIDNNAELIRRAHETVRNIYIEAANSQDEDKREAIAKHALRSEARSRIENMLHSVKPYLVVNPDELDTHPMLLNVNNGIVDLTTGELISHDRNYMLTKIIDILYRSDADYPEWKKFIQLITGGDQELAYFFQKAIGYTLTGRTDEHCLFFLYGTGQNGKSTFTEAFRRLMGDYFQRVDIEALMQNWNLGTAPNPHVANMAGARYVLASEVPENRKLNESLIKDLTGGDSLTARFLFSNPFTFTPSHKIWIFGNYKPKVSGTDWGFWRRMRVIPFNVTIPEDVRRPMSEILEAFEEEMPGILNWAVTGCLFWQSDNLNMSDAVKDATSEYRTEQDLVQQFLDEKCVMHPEYRIEKVRLHTIWRNWCDDVGEIQARKRGRRWLTMQMTGRGFEHGRDGKRFLTGLKLA
jgi:putative DNA primase/helicase